MGRRRTTKNMIYKYQHPYQGKVVKGEDQIREILMRESPSSLRIQTFLEKGFSCVSCGIRGTELVQERSNPKSPWHWNLYALTKSGRPCLMTSDHIVPKSKGGSNTSLDNRQTMCFPCNKSKGNKL